VCDGAGLGDRDDAILPEQPGERDVRRRHVVTSRDGAQRAMAEQPALLDRRVRHHRDLLLAAPGQQIELDAAPREVVEHLVGRHRSAAGEPHQLDHVIQVEIADAPVPDLAGALQREECLEGLRELRLAAPVQEIEVDAIGAQALQAALARRDRALARRVVGKHLADQEDLVAARPERVGHQLFRGAVAYISAVSISVMPRSTPRRRAAISSARRAASSAIPQVP
jgi:hypothetical protein